MKATLQKFNNLKFKRTKTGIFSGEEIELLQVKLPGMPGLDAISGMMNRVQSK